MRTCRRRNAVRNAMPVLLAALFGSVGIAPVTATAAPPGGNKGAVVQQAPPPPAPPPAPAAVDAEVTLIHASNNADAGVDPRIGKLPNIGSYKSYQLLSQS